MDQSVVVASGKIGPADGAREQDVADQGQSGVRVEEDHVSGRMPGTMPDLQDEIADGCLLARIEPAVRSERRHRRHAEHAALLRHAVEPEPVGEMRTLDRQSPALREIGGPTGVIQMTVRQQDLFEEDAIVVGGTKDPLDIASGIDDRSAHRLGAPDNGTILYERRDRDYDVTHIANASTATLIQGPPTTGEGNRSRQPR